MKKFLGLIVAFVLAISSLAPSLGQVAKANAQSFDQADNYFLEFLASDTTIDGDITFTSSPLYNQALEQNGREYIFSIGNVNGYALMVEFKTPNATFYEIEELFYNATSPFSNCQGLPVYIAHNVYLEYKDQAFYDITTGVEITDQALNQLVANGFNYFGGTTATFTTVYDEVEFATKETEQYSILYNLPDIIGATGTSCANKAGAVAIVYYDRFYEDLIPNYIGYHTLGTAIVYKGSGIETCNLTIELSELMLIGEPHAGTTFSEFQLGMETYIEDKGYTYTSSNLFTNGSFDFNKYKTALENDKPCELFLTNFAMLDGTIATDGVDSISSGYCPVSHVAVGCGYKIDRYYDENDNLVDTRTYLKVACGLNSYGIGYLNINGLTTISKAISVLVS